MEGEIEQGQVTLKEIREKVQKEMEEAGPILSFDQLEGLIAQLEQDAVHREAVIEELHGKQKETQKEIDVVNHEVDKRKFEVDTLEDRVKKLKEEIESKKKPDLSTLTGSVTKSAFSGASLKATLTGEIEKLKAELEKQQAGVRAGLFIS